MIKLILRKNLFIISTLILVSCNLPAQQTQADVGAELTAAADAVNAQLTQSAQSQATLTATSTSIVITTITSNPPSAVPPTSNCNAGQFIDDITIPDGTTMSPGENFTKTWRLKNIGTCTWTSSYAVVFTSGTSMGGPAAQALSGNVNPGQTVDVSVNLTAPGSNGTYTGNYKLRDSGGVLFTNNFYVQIKVQGGGGGGGGIFAVTSVTYDAGTFDEGGSTNCPIVTAHITANGEGDVDYHWTRSDGASAPVESVHFNSAGTKNVTTKWYLGSFWAGGDPEWQGIYIDSPNHQDFGHVNINACSTP
jgi:hypothetical protein